MLDDKPQITSIAFERRYSDDSGVQFGVRLLGRKQLEFECVGKIDFPVEELDWLIACLQKIKAEIE